MSETKFTPGPWGEAPVYAAGEPRRISVGREIWWEVVLSNNRCMAFQTIGAAKRFCSEHSKP